MPQSLFILTEIERNTWGIGAWGPLGFHLDSEPIDLSSVFVSLIYNYWVIT